MLRKPIFLAASAVEALRFIALALLADGLGAFREGEGIGSLLRYAQTPQLLFGAAFFFLWWDEARYGAYRPLALTGKGLAFVFALPLVPGVFAALRPETGTTSRPLMLFLSLVFVLLADLFGILCLIFAGKNSDRAKAAEIGFGEAHSSVSGVSTSGNNQGSELPASGIGQGGPDDIERVEV